MTLAGAWRAEPMLNGVRTPSEPGAGPDLAADEPVALVPLRLATAAMGTRFELVLGGDSPERGRAAGEAAIDEIEQWHRRLSRFASDSLLSYINRTATERSVRLDTDTFALFEDALRVQVASAGAFDIAVGEAVDSRLGRTARPAANGPCQAAETTGPPAPSFALDRSTRSIRLTRAVTLDLGAIAKGHALDLAARLLRAHGVTCALLHGGTSSIVAIGAPPGSSGWCVALGPEQGARQVLLRDRALSVSAPAGPRTTGRTHDHILDPRSPDRAPLASYVAVAGPSARLADAWSTALAVIGARPEALREEWVTWFGQETAPLDARIELEDE